MSEESSDFNLNELDLTNTSSSIIELDSSEYRNLDEEIEAIRLIPSSVEEDSLNSSFESVSFNSDNMSNSDDYLIVTPTNSTEYYYSEYDDSSFESCKSTPDVNQENNNEIGIYIESDGNPRIQQDENSNSGINLSCSSFSDEFFSSEGFLEDMEEFGNEIEEDNINLPDHF